MKDETAIYDLQMRLGELSREEGFRWVTAQDWIDNVLVVAFGEFEGADVFAALDRASARSAASASPHM
jgi:hypothetical protein